MYKYTGLLPLYHKDNPFHLYQSLISILNQDHLPDELIIVIDNIINSSHLNIIRKLNSKIIRIFYYKGPKGISGALSYGLRFSKNNIIARFDADDIYKKDRISKQLSFMKINQLDIVGSAIEEFHKKPGDLKKFRSLDVSCLYFRNPLNHMTVIFKKETILRSGGYIHLENFEDWYLWLRVKKLGYKIGNINETLVYARLGVNLFNKRHGFKYFKSELQAMNLFKSKKLINTHAYLSNILLRAPLRILPLMILNKIYIALRGK